ncbi:MAG: nucleotidyltransferase family protein [Fimbriimonadales bacterium]|nr:nucleotidyltransferase family protein [Fimbriimonadales bacterium]
MTPLTDRQSVTQVVETLRMLQPEIRVRFRAEIVGVFGSFARGEQKPESDIDLLVRFDEGASLFDLVGLGDYLESLLGCKVDILSERAIRPEIRDKILHDLVHL